MTLLLKSLHETNHILGYFVTTLFTLTPSFRRSSPILCKSFLVTPVCLRSGWSLSSGRTSCVESQCLDSSSLDLINTWLKTVRNQLLMRTPVIKERETTRCTCSSYPKSSVSSAVCFRASVRPTPSSTPP